MATVLITGAAGFIGRALTTALNGPHYVVALDLREVPEAQRITGVTYVAADIGDPKLGELFRTYQPQTVVHLASVVAAGGDPARDYAIDVLGTKNVLEASLAAGARQIVVTSSGAAYGYRADNPVPLRESDPLRGNEDFPYSKHKRLVEEMLAEWREKYPQLKQTVFRPCTVLGPGTNNQITAIFARPVVVGLSGTTTPFSLISESDVVAALAKAVNETRDGVFNLAGDGTLSLREIANLLGKRFLPLPPALLKTALWIFKTLRLTNLGPEHVKFIQYRPVLANEKLKSEFGYTPQYDAAAVFQRYLESSRQ
ncbi:MAG: SDR family oxidoreductase [Xanthobacteraceae bacterium]|nr:SDR family oxidoreductase [Xanthobacteraceae bacterium]MCW5673420.1 SDR family oxidoreductase [Xanthobacteraceae bacterium]